MISKLLRRVDAYYKLAGAPEFMQLKDEEGSDLWFGDRMSEANGDKYFAILDRSNLDAIRKSAIGSTLDTEELAGWYLMHEKTQSLIRFIGQRYNKYFPNLDFTNVLNHLEQEGSLDPRSGVTTPNPIFIFIHDLIHQVLQSDFTDSLNNQRSREDESLNPSLLDELNEDIASSMSNFQPGIKNIGQGLFVYLRNGFTKAYGNQVATDVNIRQALEKTFHQAKAELRSKIDGLANSHEFQNQKIPAQVKQMVDGFLSRAKHKMLSQLEDVIDEAVEFKMNSGYRIFELFDLRELASEYYQKINESSVVDQADSSALRGWMIECLGEMKKLNDYFKNLDNEYEDGMEDE